MKRFLLICITLGISELFRKDPNALPKDLQGLMRVSFEVKKYFSAKEIQKDLTKLLGKSFEKVHPTVTDGDEFDRTDTGERLVDDYGTVKAMISMFRGALSHDDELEESFRVFIYAKDVRPEAFKSLMLYSIEIVDDQVIKDMISQAFISALNIHTRQAKFQLAHYVGHYFVERECPNCESNPYGWGMTWNCSRCSHSTVSDMDGLMVACFGRAISYEEASRLIRHRQDSGAFREALREMGLQLSPRHVASTGATASAG